MRLSLLPPWLPYAVAGVALAALVGSVTKCRANDVERGRQEERAKVAHADADTARRELAAAQKAQPKADTVLLRAETRYRVLRDTLVLSDTVRVREALAAADSTISACVIARATCEQRAVAAERLADARLRELTARANTPTIRRRWGVGATVGFGGTYDVVERRLHTGPSVTVGVTWSF